MFLKTNAIKINFFLHHHNSAPDIFIFSFIRKVHRIIKAYRVFQSLGRPLYCSIVVVQIITKRRKKMLCKFD